MKQISVFHKGIITDIDYSKMDNQGMLLPTSNVRLLNIEGKGLVVTQVKGDMELFDLSPGFKVIGGCEYNGIAYIASCNPDTNEGEIGSFPSPGENGFDNIYRPLHNTVSGMPLRSIDFNFSLEHPIGDEMHALIDYDETVNLTMTDGVNPLKLVNSGFNQDGVAKPSRYYNLDNLHDEIQQIRNLPYNQDIQYIGETPGGQLRFGNYFFFYRYIDASNNFTEFVAESSALTVTANSNQKRNLKISGVNESSGKSIKLKIFNVDIAFSFVQFAFIRFYSDGVGGSLTEVILVDKFFGITAPEMVVDITGFETFIPFDISEILKKATNENVVQSIQPQQRRLWGGKWKGIDIDFATLANAALKIKIGCNTSKKIRRWELRDFYANPSNLKYAGYFRNEAYITGVVFVLRNGYETERFPVRGADLRGFSPGSSINDFYNNNIHLVNNNGIVVMPSNHVAPVFNNDETRTAEANILAIEFVMDEFNSWVNDENLSIATKHSRDWFKKNVRELRFVRAERVPNMVYQGLVANVYGAGPVSSMAGPSYIGNSASIPLINTNIFDSIDVNYFNETRQPNETTFIPVTRTNNSRRELNGYYQINKNENERKIRAIFSPDFIFGNKGHVIDNASDYHVQNNFDISYMSQTGHPHPRTRGRTTHLDYFHTHNNKMWNIRILGVAAQTFRISDINKVFQENSFVFPDAKKTLGVVNAVHDRVDDNQNYLIYQGDDSNRSIVVPPVIAIEIDDASDNISRAFDKVDLSQEVSPGSELFRIVQNIASIYRQDPNNADLNKLYLSELNINYFSISNTISIEQSENSYILYSGDCFVQLTSIKTRSWLPTSRKQKGGDMLEIGADVNMNIGTQTANPSVLGNIDWIYAHGQVVHVITENAVNTALRFSTPGETDFEENFKPITIGPIGGPGGATFNMWDYYWPLFPFASEPTYSGSGYRQVLTSGIESYLVNAGNSRTLSLKARLSYNPNIPKSDNRYNNRIRYSGIQESNYPPLGYRIWNYNHKEDFDHTDGPIVKIIFAFNRLISVQETSLLLHHINREEVIPGSTGELIIGTRSVLSKEPTNIAKFGSQHRFAVKRCKSGVFGWDWINGVMWRAVMIDNGAVVARAIDKENLIERYTKEIKERARLQGNINNNVGGQLRDSFFTHIQEGILISQDKNSAEVLFCFSKGDISEIMRYSEDQNTFVGHYFFKPVMFLNIKSDTISFPRNIPGIQSKGYLFGVGDYCYFYGEHYASVISFIVNGFLGEGGNIINADKLFMAMEIESPGWQFIEKIEFETLFQKTENNPFHDAERFWITPEYLMSKWAFPINTAIDSEMQFQSNSNMQGRWLKVTITMKEDAGLQGQVFIKNVITKFITSNA